MIKHELSVSRKHFALAAVGVAVKLIGSICLIAAALGVVKEVSDQIKKILLHELSK